MTKQILLILSILAFIKPLQANIFDQSGPVLVGDRVVFEANDAGETVDMSLAEYEEAMGTHSWSVLQASLILKNHLKLYQCI